jgi:adenosylcobinamide kinase/adenosylcobinamide-phosphate guanylyltransferase
LILIIGGKGQGKHRYVQKKYCLSESDFAVTFSDATDKKCFDQFHTAVKSLLESDVDPIAAVRDLLNKNPEIIVICDEIGCGVVPLNKNERTWRETVGRICCELALIAIRVERVFCGISMVLKES